MCSSVTMTRVVSLICWEGRKKQADLWVLELNDLFSQEFLKCTWCMFGTKTQTAKQTKATSIKQKKPDIPPTPTSPEYSNVLENYLVIWYYSLLCVLFTSRVFLRKSSLESVIPYGCVWEPGEALYYRLTHYPSFWATSGFPWFPGVEFHFVINGCNLNRLQTAFCFSCFSTAVKQKW